MATKKTAKAKRAPKKPLKSKKAWGQGMPTVTELKARGKELEVPGCYKMNKEHLIWAVQEAEGYAACFHRIPDCGIDDCLFKPECM